ncbi:MAG TPA: ABC transporter permease [Tepidisphaeraceae bacterium]|jgi:peptide/nickel transport system permease protein
MTELAGKSSPKPVTPPRSPTRIAWSTFRRHKIGMAGLFILTVLYGMALLADYVAPYAADDQIRELQWSPPTALRFQDDKGISLRPFIYPIRNYIDDSFNVRQEEDRTQRLYMRIFPKADQHKFLGLIPISRRLIGFDPPQPRPGETYYARFYLLGADISGRDIFSRICYGARISMTIGLVGSAIVLVIGLLVGGISGYAGGPVDNILMRLCEAIMLLPGFYLLLMLRFTFPSNLDSTTVYFAVIGILSLIGWPGLARVIRGMVLSIRDQDYVRAATAMGFGPLRIIVRHILPNTAGYVIVATTLSIPGYILGESALSVLGLGIMEPTPSWGNMLQRATEIVELDSHPWVLWPGFFIFLAVMGFNLLGDGLRDALDPRARRRE